MLKNNFSYLLILLILSIAFLGCTKEVDFNQINDFEVSPVFESSLIFFDASAPDFFVGGSEVGLVQDFITIDVFNNSFVNNNLVKGEFVLESKNSINRSYRLQIDFLNDANQLQHSFTVIVPASSSNTDSIINHTEVFEGDSLNDLKRTTKLVFKLAMLSGPPINNNTLGRIHLESKGVFYLNYQQ
jgi:hypothetical protein